MNGRSFELAQKKLRLLQRSEALRLTLAGHGRGLMPVAAGIDSIGRGVVWLRRHPHVLIAGAVALLVARPKAVWRWGRRVYLVGELWQHAREWFMRHTQSLPIRRK